MPVMDKDPFSAGGMVKLVGFQGVDPSTIADIKLIVGKKLKRFQELCREFEQIVLHLEKVHAQPRSEKYELHAQLKDKGKLYMTTITHKDLLLALETSLKKLESEVSKDRTL